MTWLADNWSWVLPVAAWLLISILNAASRHWSERAGTKRVLAFVVELVSLLASAGARVGRGPAAKLKLPGQDVPPKAVEMRERVKEVMRR